MKLIEMTTEQLTAWILGIMRAPAVGDPHQGRTLVEPDDRVFMMHHVTSDDAYRARIEAASLAALGEVAMGDLSPGTDEARAAGRLAWLMGELELRDAATMLLAIAERGEMGGHIGVLDQAAEETVLGVLADLQAPLVLYPKWAALWAPRGDLARLWEVIVAGLRTSDPARALGILPLLFERASLPLDPPFDLGSALWGFHVESQIPVGAFDAALDQLPVEARERCRAAIAWMERDDDEDEETIDE